MPGRDRATEHVIQVVRDLDGEWITARDLEWVSGRSRVTVLRVLNILEELDEYQVVRGVGRGRYTEVRFQLQNRKKRA